jgi:serine/threonine protein kinase
MNLIGQTYNGYILNKKLGSGQFGTTYLCNDIYNNIYAIKNINIDEYSKFNLNKSNIDTEIETIKKLSGYISKGNYDNREGMQYIVKYIDNFNMKINGINYMFIVMEYVDGIDMEKYIKSNNKINVENIIKIIYQLIDGLNYIHSLNY